MLRKITRKTLHVDDKQRTDRMSGRS